MSVCFLLTLPQAAERLAVSRTTLYKLIRSGEIHAVKFGRSRRVTDVEVEDFIRSQVAKAQKRPKCGRESCFKLWPGHTAECRGE